MSARMPIMRPENWSTTLKVRSSRSWPVPVRSESMYSRSGGMTSSYLFLKNRSRMRRRSVSMRIASAGSMSSTYSGSSQRMPLAARPQEEQQPDDDRREPDEADLAVGHLRDASEGIAPQGGRYEWQHAFEHEHQGERHEERRAHRSLTRRLRLPSERVPEVAQEVRVGLEQHEVVPAAEGRAVGLHAAIEGEELRVLRERRGVDRGGFGVALAAHALRVAIGFGEDHLALAVGVGADLLAFGGAGGSQFVGNALPLRLHAAVDRFAHFLRQVDALQAHVDHADADALEILVDLFPHARHDLVA